MDQMDALSMFDGISPGFDSAMTGFVALHAVAQIIGKMKLELELDANPVMFALFQGVKLLTAIMISMFFLYYFSIGFAKVSFMVNSITVSNFCLNISVKLACAQCPCTYRCCFIM